MTEALRIIKGFLGRKQEKRQSDLVTPIPTPETALLSLLVGKPFKPQGRSIMPGDCVEYDDCFLPAETVPPNDWRRITDFELIDKLFETEDPKDDTGTRARNAYCTYVKAVKEGDREAMQEADKTFQSIANFGLREVIEFNNKVRRLHKIPIIPLP